MSEAMKKREKSRLRVMMGVLRERDVVHGLTPEKLRLILEDMGPTYIKLGQLMSMRSDIIPEAYCAQLRELRTKVKPVPFDKMLKVMEDEWEVSPYEIFDSIDPNPVGSASIAQAYCAVLKDSGEQVVIKVQRPGIYKVMFQDIKLMHKFIKILRLVAPTKTDIIDFRDVLDEMWNVAKQEMDFTLEAEHLERFKELNSKVKYVDCPHVFRKLTTSKVLVMERISGYSMDNVEHLKKLGYDMSEIGEKLAENYSKQVLEDAFFHSDPHQGNIIISGGKIVFIDLGMMGELDERYKTLIKTAIEAMACNNIRKLKEVLLIIGNVYGPINHSKLYSDLDILVKKYINTNINDIDMGAMLTEVLELCNGQNIAVPSSVTMLVRGLVTMEGVISECCPGINMFSIITSHMSGNIFSKFDFEKETLNFLKDTYSAIKRGIEIPVTLADLLSMAVHGEIKANLEVVGSEEPLKKIDSMVFEIIVCALSCSLNLGSAILCTTQMEPRFLGIPLLGVLGYLGSVILVIWLICKVIANRKKNRGKKF